MASVAIGEEMTPRRLAEYHREKAAGAERQRDALAKAPRYRPAGIEHAGQRMRFHLRAAEMLKSLALPEGAGGAS